MSSYDEDDTTDNIVINADGTENDSEDMNEAFSTSGAEGHLALYSSGVESNEEDEGTGIQSFAETEDEANERENGGDVLAPDEALDTDLSELKRNLYDATVYGPPVGSDEAQDMRNLERYEGLLLQLYNLTMGALATSAPSSTVPPNILAQYPNPTQPLVVAYYQRICDFQRTNKDRQIKDVLKDLLNRRLREQTSPYSRADDGE
jgi:hypothetical protein